MRSLRLEQRFELEAHALRVESFLELVALDRNWTAGLKQSVSPHAAQSAIDGAPATDSPKGVFSPALAHPES